MGIKDLWRILTPYCERRPIYELQGKIVAIDLAGWVCESLNVVDYFVHPRQYLKNLYFRTCYLLLEGVTPVFVLEGEAPLLKADVISKRNEIQFRGVKPREPPKDGTQKVEKAPKGRTRFNFVLKKCEELLQCMGITCVQAPGEAEAFCAFLNRKGLVDGVISQDSDCFAYGAIKVYRNFSVSTQGTSSSGGGAVDIYDMDKIRKLIDFGQNKVIVLGLLCGCDYCPDGVDGVGRDSVLKFFNKYKNNEILERIKDWRSSDHKYTSLELKVDDKNVCVNCGHMGKLYSHTRSGCPSCRTPVGCDESLWKEQRLSIKAELSLRKRALMNPNFPSQEIINEFLSTPKEVPILDLRWTQPNLVKFVRQLGKNLQWNEIYSFRKFLPLLTRWQVRTFSSRNTQIKEKEILKPSLIKKKRVLKGVQSYEIVWIDERKCFDGLIPEDDIKSFLNENQNPDELWTTIEPSDVFDKAYSELVELYNSSKAKSKPKKQTTKKKTTKKRERDGVTPRKVKKSKNDSLHDMSYLISATDEIAESMNKKKSTKEPSIKNFFKCSTPVNKTKQKLLTNNFSTPKISGCLSDLEDDEGEFDYSNIIREIVSKQSPVIKQHIGKKLEYEHVHHISRLLNTSKDDLDLLVEKKIPKSLKKYKSDESISHGIPLADYSYESFSNNYMVDSVLDRFLKRENVNLPRKSLTNKEVSFFFSPCGQDADAFEQSLVMHQEEESLSSSSNMEDDHEEIVAS